MIIDIHTHLFVEGWVPKDFFHGVARFITHENAKQGIHQSNVEVGDYLLQAGSDPDAEMLLSEMAEAGIEKSVVFPLDLGLALGEPKVPIDEVNRLFADLGKTHPDKLIPFASVDPRRERAADLFRSFMDRPRHLLEQLGNAALGVHLHEQPCGSGGRSRTPSRSTPDS